MTLTQFPMDVKQTVFGFVEQQQSARRTRSYLAREFGADAAACARDQDHFPTHDLLNLFRFVGDFVPVQKIPDVELPQRSLRYLSINQLSECWQSANGQVRLPADGEYSAHLLRCRAGYADQHLVRVTVMRNRVEVVHTAHHRDAVNRPSLPIHIIVQQRNWFRRGCVIRSQLFDQACASITRSDDDSSLFLAPRPQAK